MSTKSAPSPWRVGWDGGLWSATHDGYGVSAYQVVTDADGVVVALVVAHNSDHRADLDTETNSTLIAAAPDLLKACQQALLYVNAGGRDILSAAIAKATEA